MGAILATSQTSPSSEVVERAAEVLRAGGVAVLPTDSVYGICCAATPGNPAHGRIFDIKRRDRAQTLSRQHATAPVARLVAQAHKRLAALSAYQTKTEGAEISLWPRSLG